MPQSLEDAKAQFQASRDLEAAKRYLKLAIALHDRLEFWDSDLRTTIAEVAEGLNCA